MKLMPIACFLGFTLLAGCGPRYVDFFPYHDNGKQKPCVAFMPIKASCSHELGWDVSAELTENVRDRSKYFGNLYLVPDQQVKQVQSALGDTDLMNKDLSYYRNFKGCDFIVVSELVEHTCCPYRDCKLPVRLANAYVDIDEVAVLSMKVLVKVVDIRTPKPRLASQELITTQHVIPAGNKAENYQEICWGSSGYRYSHMKQAHDVLVKDVRERIEQITHATPM